MTPIKPVQPVRQQPRRRGIQNTEAEADQKLSRREIALVASSGIGTVGMLTLIAWRLLPISAHIVPFVAMTAWPALTLLAIIYQAVVYRRQWNAMQASLRQTDLVIGKMQAQLTVIERQAKAMENSVIQTEKLVAHSGANIKIAEKSARYSQRAYLTVTQRKAIETGFFLTIENSGNTPAVDVSVMTICAVGCMAPSLPTDPSQRDYVSIGILGPKDTYPFFVPYGKTVSEADRPYFDDINWGFNWWCTGTIFYRDIFQSETSISDYRSTEFSFYHDRKRKIVQAGFADENRMIEEYAADKEK